MSEYKEVFKRTEIKYLLTYNTIRHIVINVKKNIRYDSNDSLPLPAADPIAAFFWISSPFCMVSI